MRMASLRLAVLLFNKKCRRTSSSHKNVFPTWLQLEIVRKNVEYDEEVEWE